MLKIDNIGVRLQQRRKSLGYTQKRVAEEVDITEATLSRYETGEREPKAEILSKLSRVLKCSTDYLLGKTNIFIPTLNTTMTDNEISKIVDNEKVVKLSGSQSEIENMLEIMVNKRFKQLTEKISNFNPIPVHKIPILGRISAGLPLEAQEETGDYTFIDSCLNPKDYFALKVDGDSMNNIMKDGSIAIVHKQETLETGEIGVILVNGYDATVKKFKQQAETVILMPDSTNNEHMPQIYNINEVPIKILGKVVEVVTKL